MWPKTVKNSAPQNTRYFSNFLYTSKIKLNVAARRQVLVRNKCCELIWVPASDGSIPFGALQGGFSTDKESVFIGRVAHDGATSIGLVISNYFRFLNFYFSLILSLYQVHPSRGICLYTYGGEEISHNDYEVLVVKTIPL